jgi:alanine dehydrogenase
MPGAYSRTATQALNNVTQRWITLLADNGVAGAARIRKEVIGAINCAGGKLTCAPVGEAHGIPVASAEEIIGL